MNKKMIPKEDGKIEKEEATQKCDIMCKTFMDVF